MAPGPVVLRCDGDATIGAGHVGRCLPIAAAIRRAGGEALFAGHFGAIAADLLAAAGYETLPAADAPAGIPANARAAVIDSYSISAGAIALAAAERPVVAFCDSDEAPDIGAAVLLDYHLDARAGGLTGPDFAPVDPAFTAARRTRREGPTLVVLGASTVGRGVLEALVDALLHSTTDAIEVAGELDAVAGERVRALGRVTGLTEPLARAGAIVCGAGVTSYEAACAGVPALLVVLATNQERVGRAFAAHTAVVDGRAGFDAAAAVAALRASRLAHDGPALVDGYGAARVRDALRALEQGTPRPPLQRYRPATRGDAADLLAWRNHPATRAASITKHVIARAEHEAWLEAVLRDPDRTLLVVQRAGEAIASVRFDRCGDEAEISVHVAPDRQAAGAGTRAIRETTELQLAAHPRLARVAATVSSENARSQRAFERAGYRPCAGPPGAWVHLEAVREHTQPEVH